MTLAQMRLYLDQGERIKRRERAAFLADVYLAASAVMGGEDGAKAVQQRLTDLIESD